MAKKEVFEEVEDVVEDGTPAIFLRKVDVVIQSDDSDEVVVIKANPDEPQEKQEEQTEE